MDLSQPVSLKKDALVRMKHPAAQRTTMINEFERSGLSGAAFARSVGVDYQTFASWVQKRRDALRPASVPFPC